MNVQRTGVAWVLAAAVTCSSILTPTEARADSEDTLEALPFMVFAAALTATIIIVAVNQKSDSSSDSADTTTDAGTTQNAWKRYDGPMRPAPILGFSGRF